MTRGLYDTRASHIPLARSPSPFDHPHWLRRFDIRSLESGTARSASPCLYESGATKRSGECSHRLVRQPPSPPFADTQRAQAPELAGERGSKMQIGPVRPVGLPRPNPRRAAQVRPQELVPVVEIEPPSQPPVLKLHRTCAPVMVAIALVRGAPAAVRRLAGADPAAGRVWPSEEVARSPGEHAEA